MESLDIVLAAIAGIVLCALFVWMELDERFWMERTRGETGGSGDDS